MIKKAVYSRNFNSAIHLLFCLVHMWLIEDCENGKDSGRGWLRVYWFNWSSGSTERHGVLCLFLCRPPQLEKPIAYFVAMQLEASWGRALCPVRFN